MKKIRKDLQDRLVGAYFTVLTKLADSLDVDCEAYGGLYCSKDFRAWHEDLVHKYLNKKVYTEKEKLILHIMSFFRYTHDVEYDLDIITMKSPQVIFGDIIESNGGHYKNLTLLPLFEDVITDKKGEQLARISDFWYLYYERFPDDFSNSGFKLGHQAFYRYDGMFDKQEVV